MGVGYDALPATKLQNLGSFVSDRVSEKTFRPEFRLPWTADARLDLNRLSPAQVASMIESLDFGNELPTAVVGQIISKTDGAT
jgi:hypothetical protein